MTRTYRKTVQVSLVLVDSPVKKSLSLTVMQPTTRYVVHLKEGDTEPLTVHQLNRLAVERGVKFNFKGQEQHEIHGP